MQVSEEWKCVVRLKTGIIEDLFILLMLFILLNAVSSHPIKKEDAKMFIVPFVNISVCLKFHNLNIGGKEAGDRNLNTLPRL